jgi:N-methylhydantoinase A
MAQMDREGIEKGGVKLLRFADVRYLGQGFELEVAVDGGKLAPSQIADLVERFHQAHRRRYGYESHDNPVEIVNLRVVAVADLPRPELAAAPLDGTTDPASALTGNREVYFDGKSVPTAVYDRTSLRPGDVISGPAIIEQLDATTVVWPEQTARVDAYTNLMLDRKTS